MSKLRAATADALEYVSAQPDVELFASADANLTVRLNYTSHIPSNGLEEPKSAESFGLGLLIVFRSGSEEERRTGFGSEPNDLSLEGARSALHKARAGAVVDPEFVSLPKPDKFVQPRADHSSADEAANYDPAIMDIDSSQFVNTGWRMLERNSLPWARISERNSLRALITSCLVATFPTIAAPTVATTASTRASPKPASRSSLTAV